MTRQCKAPSDSESDDELEESDVAPAPSWRSVGKELERGVSSELRSCSCPGKSVSRMPCRAVFARPVPMAPRPRCSVNGPCPFTPPRG